MVDETAHFMLESGTQSNTAERQLVEGEDQVTDPWPWLWFFCSVRVLCVLGGEEGPRALGRWSLFSGFR